MRQLCHGKTEPIQALCRAFNEETRCGEEMQLYSDLLEEAVLSIVDAKEDTTWTACSAQAAPRRC